MSTHEDANPRNGPDLDDPPRPPGRVLGAVVDPDLAISSTSSHEAAAEGHGQDHLCSIF